MFWDFNRKSGVGNLGIPNTRAGLLLAFHLWGHCPYVGSFDVSTLTFIAWFLSFNSKRTHTEHLAESGELAGHVLLRKYKQAVNFLHLHQSEHCSEPEFHSARLIPVSALPNSESLVVLIHPCGFNDKENGNEWMVN